MKPFLSKIKWTVLKWLGIYKPTPNRFHITTLNQRIIAFFESYKQKELPKKEQHLLPEILIPCYNHGKYLPFLLKSLENFRYPITIINDNSTDNSSEIIQNLKQKYNFKLITNEENLLQWGSINKAIEASSNNLFVIINADDFVFPNWIEYAVETIKSQNIFLIGGTYVFIDLPTEYLESKNLETAIMAQNIKINPDSGLKIFQPTDALLFDNDNSINMSFSGCAFLKSAWKFVDGMQPSQNRVSWHDDRDLQMRIATFFPVAVSENISGFVRKNSSQRRGMS